MNATRASRLLLLVLLPGRRAPTTQATYRRDLERWHAWTATQGRRTRSLPATVAALLRSPQQALEQVARYQAALCASALSSASVNRRLAPVRALIAMAAALGLVPWHVQPPRVPQQATQDRRGPQPADLAAVLAQLTGAAPVRARDRAGLRLSWDLGLRRGELVRLTLADLDAPRGVLRVAGKGGSITFMTLPTPTRDALGAWLLARGDAPGPLLCACDVHGQVAVPLRPVSAGQWWRRVALLGRRAGLDVLRPHGLRHGSATAALEAGLPLHAVQRWGRWRSAATVQHYDDQRRDLGGLVAASLAQELDQAQHHRAQLEGLELLYGLPSPPEAP